MVFPHLRKSKEWIRIVYEDVIRDTPNYQEFLTIDELNENSLVLARKYPHVVEHLQIGVSTYGKSIYTLKIGDGERNAVLIGFPHPNEPIGSLTIEYLSRSLAEDKTLRRELGFTWYFIKAADIDGARLNEGWFKGKHNNVRHMLNFYRTPAHKQIEWTFPIEYKTLKWNQPSPETKAVMSLIDQTRPDLVFSLHNAAFSGIYFYVSDPCPSLYSKLQDLARSEELPLHLGEPESPYMKRLADAIFLLPPASEIYDFYERYGEKDPATVLNRGTSAMEYAKRVCNAFTIICEMPYIYDQRISDTTLTSTIRREAVLKSVEISTETFDLIKHHWDKMKGLLEPKSPFYEVLEDYQKRNIDLLAAKKKWAETNPSLERPATASELFNSLVITKYYDMRWIGQLIRLIDQSKTKQSEEVLETERKVLFEELLRLNSEIEKESKYEVIPIQKLVKVQVGTALNAATFLNK